MNAKILLELGTGSPGAREQTDAPGGRGCRLSPAEQKWGLLKPVLVWWGWGEAAGLDQTGLDPTQLYIVRSTWHVLEEKGQNKASWLHFWVLSQKGEQFCASHF